jgi:cytidine deaminase
MSPRANARARVSKRIRSKGDFKSVRSEGAELVFALVAAVGTDLDMVQRALIDTLAGVRYRAQVIQLSQLLHDFERWRSLPSTPEDDRIHTHMDAGNDLRQTLGSGDALAAGAIARITELRLTTGSPEPLSRYAYILRSLKHPEEVKTLRRVYGEGLTVVAAYEPRPARVRNLSNRLAQSRHSSRPSEFGDSAEKLMIRDESERGNIFGQKCPRHISLG